MGGVKKFQMHTHTCTHTNILTKIRQERFHGESSMNIKSKEEGANPGKKNKLPFPREKRYEQTA